MDNTLWENIASYLNGEADLIVKREIEEKLKNDIQFKSEMEEIEKDLDLIDKTKKMNQFDENKAFDQLKLKMEVNGILPEKSKPITIPLFFKVAAIIVVTVSLGIVTWLQFGGSNVFTNYASFYANQPDKIKEVLLPDGTKVFLNYKSKVVLPSAFDNNQRVVNLSGEAFFDVARDTLRPFIINIDDAMVKVLGTSFNVKKNAKEDQIEVLVTSGKVNLSDKKNRRKGAVLTKGEFGVLKKEKVFKANQKRENYMAWKTRKLVFKSSSFEEVANSIQDTYHVDMEYNDNMKNCRLTTTFDNLSLEEILKTIKETHNIDFEIKNKKVILSGDGC